jgi:hypothetical protein
MLSCCRIGVVAFVMVTDGPSQESKEDLAGVWVRRGKA